MESKERKELLETIKTRVEVWDNKTYEFCNSDYPQVQLKNGNVFEVSDLRVEQCDVHEDVIVTLHDEIIGFTECNAQNLTDDSLERIAESLPLTNTIFVTAHTENSKESFCICSVPMQADFQTAEQLEEWLKHRFPVLDWEQDDVLSFVCYTEFNDHTGPYLLAELNLGE